MQVLAKRAGEPTSGDILKAAASEINVIELLPVDAVLPRTMYVPPWSSSGAASWRAAPDHVPCLLPAALPAAGSRHGTRGCFDGNHQSMTLIGLAQSMHSLHNPLALAPHHR